MAHVNKVMIPESPINYPKRYVKYPFIKIRLVYFIGYLLKD